MEAVLGFAVFIRPNDQPTVRFNLRPFRELPFARILFVVGQEFAGQIHFGIRRVHDLDVVVKVPLRILNSGLVFCDNLVDSKCGIVGLGRLHAEGKRLGLGTGR